VSLERRTPLKRGKPLKRTGRLSQKSKAKEAAAADEYIEREFVFARDGRRCRAAGLGLGCWGRLTVHHLQKSSQGGEYSRNNLITLCVACNGWVEDNPDDAHRLGLVVRRAEALEDAWARLHRAGLAATPVLGSGPTVLPARPT
jgi:5-methylcytosine-specific restriction endonuclease McrA